MMEIIISAIIVIGFIALSILGDKNPKKIGVYRKINLILGIIGVIALIFSYCFGRFTITSVSRDASWIEWADNMFGIYFNLSLPIFAVCLAAVIVYYLVSLAQKKVSSKFRTKIRKITSVASSAALLTLAIMYAPFTANKIFPLDMLIFIAGIGQALAMRLTYALEYTVRKNKTEK